MPFFVDDKEVSYKEFKRNSKKIMMFMELMEIAQNKRGKEAHRDKDKITNKTT